MVSRWISGPLAARGTDIQGTTMLDDFVIHVMGLSTSTLFIITLLVMASSYIMLQFIDSRGLTFIFAIGFQAGALILHYLSTIFDVVLLGDADSNLIAISTIGMIIGLGVMLVVMRSVSAVADATRHKVER